MTADILEFSEHEHHCEGGSWLCYAVDCQYPRDWPCPLCEDESFLGCSSSGAALPIEEQGVFA